MDEARLTVEKGNQLLPGALGTKGKSNGREAMDGVETQEYVVVLKRNGGIGGQQGPTGRTAETGEFRGDRANMCLRPHKEGAQPPYL